MAVTIDRIGDTRDDLGENPLWDHKHRVLYWVDVHEGEIFRLNPARGEVKSWQVPGQVGSMALREKDGAVVSLDSGLHFFDFGSGKVTFIADPESDQPSTRYNDGKVDARGRFIVGSMGQRGELIGAFYRLDPNLKLVKLGGEIGCYNGPCWSPDGRTFYYSDSVKQEIYACDYDLSTGAIANTRLFASTKALDGAPDGCTVDAEGRLWLAVFNSGKIACFKPNGEIERLIDVPPKLVTSVNFGGDNLDELYVTSLSSTMGGYFTPGDADGGLYVVHGLGVKGRAEPRFAG